MRPSLASDASPEAYAEAMIRCQGWAPSCSDCGECLYDGQCFAQPGTGKRRAAKLLRGLICEESDDDAAMWLSMALKIIEASP
jgi:hypothetical protein